MDGQTLRHVAIIMDGNGRWAGLRGLPRLAGHRQGAAAVQRVVSHCREAGLRYLTLFAFSTENWGRPALEVQGLMELLVRFLAEQEPELRGSSIELAAIGDLDRLPARARRPLDRAVASTRGATGMRLTLALSYGGHDEIVRASRRLAGLVAEGKLRPHDIDGAAFARALDTADTPPVDLLIRTGGERRLSNFLLWQAAYAELRFTDRLWPDFAPDDLDDAVAWFHDRRRTFGLVEAVG
ncbi:MAG: polyprenyl diphosphate synthase [Thermoanaerobaculales bacterium]|jgi:undecaprenyl diphosphate synthase|nr:polyprenyl diphosphate synthase [Thermoanaerobaculales bacterium]